MIEILGKILLLLPWSLMLFAKLFPTKIVPIKVPPGGLKYAYFSICVLLVKGFHDVSRATIYFSSFGHRVVFLICSRIVFVFLFTVITWTKPLKPASWPKLLDSSGLCTYFIVLHDCGGNQW